MAEEKKAAEEKKKGFLIIALVMVNFLTVAGIGAYVFFFQKKAAVASAPAAPPKPKVRALGALVEMNPIIANLDDPAGGRYIKITPFLEVNDEKAKVDVEKHVVPIRSALLVYFSGLKVNDTLGADRKTKVRDELKSRINEMLGAPLVKQVHFSEFVVQ